LFRFKPFYINVINRILSDSVDEHVQYIEYRHEPGKVFEIVEGRQKRIGEAGELELLTSLVDDFKATHKNFFGVKLIWPTQRGGSAVVSALQNTAKFANIYPNFVIGYDLLGQEDKGFSLLRNIDMIDGLLANLTAANTTFSKFYHSGESAWPGDVNPSSRPGDSSPDANLFDAILVDTRRIGHGFALFKHPVLLDKVGQSFRETFPLISLVDQTARHCPRSLPNQQSNPRLRSRLAHSPRDWLHEVRPARYDEVVETMPLLTLAQWC
jgi:adenosine deaminase CECR1